jgi:hypothetical protein
MQSFQWQVLLAFMDDRKTKIIRDQRDRLTREAQAQARHSLNNGEAAVSPSNSSFPSAEIPGSGHILSSSEPIVDEPPYHD